MYSDDVIMFTRLSPVPLAFKEEHCIAAYSGVFFYELFKFGLFWVKHILLGFYMNLLMFPSTSKIRRMRELSYSCSS